VAEVRRLTAVVLAMVLGGCVAATEPEPMACGADGMQGLVGQDKAVFAAMTLPMGTRIIPPGTAITEDYSPSRLNVDLDDKGRISRVWCG
jgi:hypothetical protein